MMKMKVPQKDIDDLRDTFLQELKAKGDSSIHPSDLNRIKNDDKWIQRFHMHHEGDKKLALAMMWEVMEWRKSFNVNDLNRSTIRMDYLAEGTFFARGRDKDGCALFIFKCKKHVKDARNMDELKKCVVYWLEFLERQEEGKLLTLFFDMEGCGLSNMDMEFTKYLIGLFKQYYPYFLNYIIIYEMSWILNAAFSVIKSMLPEKAVEKIKMLKKANINTYVPLDQALTCWGGQDDYVFSVPPEPTNDTPNNNSVSSNKKVHFADGSPMSEVAGGDKDCDGDVLCISPSSVINFTVKDDDEVVSTIDLQNADSTINISYKMKTTAPEKFRVRPSAGILCPGEKATITVTLLPAYQHAGLTKDKFLIMSMPIDNPNMTPNQIVDLWKNTAGKNVKQHRLRCTQMSTDITKNGNIGRMDNYSSVVPEQSELAKLTSSVSKLQESQQSLHNAVNFSQILQFVTLTLVILLGIVLCYVANRVFNSDSAVESCLRNSEL